MFNAQPTNTVFSRRAQVDQLSVIETIVLIWILGDGGWGVGGGDWGGGGRRKVVVVGLLCCFLFVFYSFFGLKMNFILSC